MRKQELKRGAVLAAVCMLMLLVGPVAGAEAELPDSVTVFAAASTTNALTEIGRLFTDQNLGELIPSFASSSTLAKQIESGAPANLFLSANSKWMDYLEEKKMIDGASRFDLLGNRIVLIAPAEAGPDKVAIGSGFDLSGLLGDGRLAMGDPEHVPAGIYGRQALEKLGVWESIKGKVARCKDVRAALVLVERGEAPLGIVYATDAAVSEKIKVVGYFPEDSHSPIVYPVALVAGGETSAAKRFMDFLKTSQAKTIFEKYGFTVR
ncbi:MAG: molybdate ABC transporter substrate-binding protein [Desulforhabdus sp.]|jgi:molybdate transport system substrate-binding protein|nr:molybdate ABC transporter substrate-binding protein [Desulforhabdus sp.]